MAYMNSWRRLRELERFGKNQKSRKCPRCGDIRMNDDVRQNVLNRRANVYVCDMCGVEEALDAAAGRVKPFKAWAYFTEGAEKYE